MSRPLRIEYEDAYYHVMNRGRGRQVIFPKEEYFRAFEQTLEEAHDRFGIEIQTYCLMSNHYHLLVKTPEGNLQRAMRHVGGVYTQRYNRLRKTDGALFRGRYKAILVDHDEYLLHLSKYIHRNPLEARMAGRLESYQWSSYPCYINQCKPKPWLYREEVYGQLHVKRRIAAKYQAFVQDKTMDEVVEAFYNRERLGAILGGEDFVSGIQDQLDELSDEIPSVDVERCKPSLTEIVKAVSEYYGVSEDVLYTPKKGRGARNQPRQLAMYLSQRVGDYRLTEIAKVFSLKHYGGVSNAISMIKRELEADKSLKTATNTIINRLDP